MWPQRFSDNMEDTIIIGDESSKRRPLSPISWISDEEEEEVVEEGEEEEGTILLEVDRRKASMVAWIVAVV